MIDPRRRSCAAAAAVLATVLLLAIGSLPAASPPPPAPGLSPKVPASAIQLPVALAAPWSARSGYNSANALEVRSSAPETGTVDVNVALWPSDPHLFAPSTGGRSLLSGPQAVASAYGLPAAQYAQLESYFTGQGVRVIHAWPDRLSLSLEGPADAVDRAFGTTVMEGSFGGQVVRFPSNVPTLPNPYRAEVAAISGLSSGFATFHLPLKVLPASVPAPATQGPTAGRTTSLVTPTTPHVIYQLDSLYNLSGTPRYATGVGIALVLWGNGFSWSDINAFFQTQYPPQFPKVTVAAFPVDGAPPPSQGTVSDPSGGSQELTLDVEWSGSQAPGATLDAVYAPDGPASNNYSPSDTGLEDALSQAVTSTPGVRVVSMSFGTVDGSDPAFQAAFAVTLASAQSQGITVLASSGDNGGAASGGCQGAPAPQFPASSPAVLAVGGTAPLVALDPLGVVTGLASEPAWNLSGGGYSVLYPAPAWQLVGSAAGPISTNGHRGIPDVAGPAYYDQFYFNGATAFGRGTSFAAPMWAGIVAEMDAVRGSSMGFLTPRLYQLGALAPPGGSPPGLSDITTGANCIGPATAGWDTATGWGSPRALALYEALSGSFVDLSLTPSESSLTPGTQAEVQVRVANATSGAPIGNLPVSLTLSALDSVGICTGQLAKTAGTTDASGRLNISIGVPTCYFGIHAAIVATIASGGYYGSSSVTLPVNLVGLYGILAVTQVYPYNLIAFVVIVAIAVVIGWRLGLPRRKTRLPGPPGPNVIPPPPPGP